MATTTTANPPATRRYTRLAQALHWLTALLLFTTLPIAWVLTALPEKSPRAGPLFSLHASLGLTIFALVAIRVVWRLMNPPPPLPNEPRALEWAGKISHWLLYLVLFGMPISGFVMSASSGHPVSWFGLPLPALPKNEALVDLADKAHATGQWAVYALVALHLLATVWHLWLRRDAVLARMLPAQTHAPEGL